MENGGGEREKAGDGGRSRAIGGVRPSGAAAAAAPGRHVMRWESFLPRRSLRVLLVEGDDSTRHIVTALLRKCNYRVAGVADGMKAWEVMKERRYSFDLVLTEVAMPLLSGIGLLTNIMGAQECKNIPVIMMSTHDSVNVVLKCMLKGAVDFLVKPVRKNELRNLWQHVWRRRCSNRYSIASDNNTASNQISANIGGRSKIGEASDEGSNAQTSDSKRDIEIESGQKHEELHHVEERRTSEGEADPDSVKDTVIRASMSKMDDVWNTNMIVGVRVDVSLPIQEVSGAKVTQEQDRPCNISSDRKALELVRCTEGNKDDPKPCQNNDPNESLQNMIVFVEPVSNGQCSYAVLKKDALVKDGLRETEKNSFANDTSNVGTSPLWELSLTRPRSNGCIQAELKQKHVLKHSVSSAFSRYGEKRVHSFQKSVSSDLCTRTREGVEECHSLVSIHGIDNDKGSPFSCKEKTLSSPQGNESETTVYFQASSTNMEKVGLSSQPIENGRPVHSITVEDTTLHRPQHGFIPVPIPVGTIPYQSSCAGYGGILQPVFYPETSFAPQVSDAVEEPASRVPSEHPVLHSHHLIDRSSSLDFYHHEVGDHSHHWRPTIDISEPGESRELCRHLDKAYHYGSCIQDVLKGSGSNGSGETADGAGNTGNALESGNESGVQNGNRKILDCDRSRREAALIKFRLKRKDRCFEKKVRYHGRKKLAEQRPRIKGQFVRQKFQSPQQQEKGRIGC